MPTQTSLQQVADYFISKANECGEDMTNLKLQKLVYYAQTWHLGLLGTPLFDEECQAWVHGPVVAELYHQYKHHTRQPIERPDLSNGSFEKIEAAFGPETQEVLASVADMYFDKDAYDLELMTHVETPWLRARGNRAIDDVCKVVIEKEWMKEWATRYVNAFA